MRKLPPIPEAGPADSPAARRLPRPSPVIVLDPDNSAVVTRYLADVDQRRRTDPAWTRVVVRPTPGSGNDRNGLALDVMAALGKNPEQLRQDKLGTSTWDLAVAWLGEARPTDVFLDRAHTIDRSLIAQLLQMRSLSQVSANLSFCVSGGACWCCSFGTKCLWSGRAVDEGQCEQGRE